MRENKNNECAKIIYKKADYANYLFNEKLGSKTLKKIWQSGIEKQKTWEEKAREYNVKNEYNIWEGIKKLRELYKKALEEKNNEIEELKTEIIYNRKQIEKMKCCENCYHDNCRGSICRSCEGYNNWRIDK